MLLALLPLTAIVVLILVRWNNLGRDTRSVDAYDTVLRRLAATAERAAPRRPRRSPRKAG